MTAIQTVLLLTMMSGMLASAASVVVLGQIPASLTPEVQEAIKQAMSVMDDGKLRIVCICGALGGGVLSAALYPLGEPKKLASKIVGSTIAGIAFSPKIMTWWGWRIETDNVLCMSAAVSLLSWSILQIAIPLAGTCFSAWFPGLFKNNSPPDQK